jgi:hypothetical protein
MPARRRAWASLTEAYRKRLARAGITESRYQRGENLSRARGHGQTPEHPREAQRDLVRYRKYVEKKEKRERLSRAPEDEAHELNSALDNAFRNIHGRLHPYVKYRRETVLANVYGGQTPESGAVPGMSLAQARWTAQADTEELRSRAEEQYRGNPWWYH